MWIFSRPIFFWRPSGTRFNISLPDPALKRRAIIGRPYGTRRFANWVIGSLSDSKNVEVQSLNHSMTQSPDRSIALFFRLLRCCGLGFWFCFRFPGVGVWGSVRVYSEVPDIEVHAVFSLALDHGVLAGGERLGRS